MAATPELMLGYVTIPFEAVTSAASAEDADFPHENLVVGGTAIKWKRGSAGTSATVTWDLGASADTQAAEYAIFGHADYLTDLVSGEIDIKLKASTDNFSASNVTILSKDDLAIADLLGPKSDHYLLCGNESIAYRYWRADFASSSSYDYELSKFHFGLWFRFGNSNPIYPYTTSVKKRSQTFTSDSGASYRAIMGQNRREYAFRWHVTDAVRDTFITDVLPRLEHTVAWLYAPNEKFRNVLNGETIVPVWLDDYSIASPGPVKDYNFLDLKFIEDIS